MENNRRFKVFNDNAFDGAVLVMNHPNKSQVVKAHSFVYMTDDDIAFNISRNTIFQAGLLRIDTTDDILEENGIVIANNPNFATKDEIIKILNGSQKKLEAWLDTITEPHVINEVFEIASGMNLSISKMRALQAKMPNRDILDV